MYDVLNGLRIIEAASFVAGPSCGLHLLQFGAEVIRFDDIGGGPDFDRWPRSPQGASLYWEGLNKGKKSVAINLKSPEGRALATRLITAPGEAGGIFVTNYPVDGFLAHDKLVGARPDLITVRVLGWADGTSAVDYTVNAAVGVPDMTGPAGTAAPVNHVLPAWDLLAGAYSAFALLALERRRKLTGVGGELRLPLSDLAIASLGHLGQIAEVTVSGSDRAKGGNELFGAFGRDFVTADGQRIMLVGLTQRQWTGLIKALGLTSAITQLEAELGASLLSDAGLRFEHRDRLNALVQDAVSGRSLDSLSAAFKECGVCWGPYQTLSAALSNDPRFGTANPILDDVTHPSGHSYPTPGAAATVETLARQTAPSAPRLGQHTDEVLDSLLGLTSREIGDLHDRNIVAGPPPAGKAG